MDKSLLEFSVSVYGQLEKYNDVLSKSRCRIFYKYENRNGTYITDEFAELLLSSLPYTPVKGIYDYDDYTDHGVRRSEGRIYGIVPENPNIAWEKHLDEDGVEREYACSDVLIFTALYKEATEIIGKGQSMELYEPSMQYHQEIINGQQWVVFDKGSFLGLQVLGDDVEPCFEGASFYTLKQSIEDIINQIVQISANYSKQQEGGNKKMKLNFKLSDREKHDALWSLLNPEYTEEGNWTIQYTITEVYDDYALAYDYSENKNYRIYFNKNDEDNTLTISEKVPVFIMDVTEKEKQTVDTLRMLNGDTYELVSDTLTNAQANLEKNSEFGIKIEELQTANSTLTTEVENSKELYDAAQTTINALTEENETLKTYKRGIETSQKEEVLVEYQLYLDETLLNNYRENLDKYTVMDLDKELAYELKKTNPSVFTNEPQERRFPKDELQGGIEEILAKY